MAQAKSGDTVKVHYTGRFEDGTVFDSSREREPFELTLGTGDVIPGFENGIIGMSTGETKTISIPPEEAYGPVRDDLIISVHKENFPENITPTVGQQLQLRQPEGNLINVVITEIDGDNVTLDANHPLAGKTLEFEIELLEIAE